LPQQIIYGLIGGFDAVACPGLINNKKFVCSLTQAWVIGSLARIEVRDCKRKKYMIK
jgi:hypothetical protein